MKKNNKTPKLRFSGYTDDWEQRKLGECFSERVESMPDGELISVTINDGIKKFSELGRHDNSNDNKSKYKKVCVGDIAYNSMRMWQGASGYSPYEGIVSPAYYIYQFKDNSFNRKYFHYLLRACYKDEFRRLSGGIREGQWDLAAYNLESMLIILPSKEEQNEIVDYLDSKCAEIDGAIKDKQQQLETLEEYKKTLIYEYVTGKKEVA